jgi:hypothetical protein
MIATCESPDSGWSINDDDCAKSSYVALSLLAKGQYANRPCDADYYSFDGNLGLNGGMTRYPAGGCENRAAHSHNRQDER